MAGTAPGYAPGEMTLSRTGDKVYMCSVYDLTEQVGHSLTGKHPTGVFSDSVRSRTGDKVRNHPARRRNEAFGQAFLERLAES